MFSKTYRRILLSVIVASMLCACAAAPGRIPEPSAARREAPSPPSAESPKTGGKGPPSPSSPSASAVEPRVVASLELTEQGRRLLTAGQPDQAIGTLERALNLSPGNGRACYYLAEAWLAKGGLRQAKSFNRLAEMYLRNEGEWKERVPAQRERIEKRQGKEVSQ
jgi:tetratricopeptide (TPR) repeat protein